MIKLKSLYLKIISALQNIFLRKKVFYITETADWVVKEIGISILSIIKNEISHAIAYSTCNIKKSIIHYGTEGVFFNAKRVKVPHSSNKIIVTWYHIKDDDLKQKRIAEADKYVDIWQTSCIFTKNKLLKLGINHDKIKLIPIGLNLDIYKPISCKIIEEKKETLEICKEAVVIGLFQKDGNGWGEGLEPKMEKGPDIFCDVIEKLSKKHKIFVLLTGPARGYVKNRLDNMRVSYFHEFLEDPSDVVNYFQLCDLYVVASREEGGPKAILESMACGVPIISTKVGMAPDVIEDGVDGFLCDIEDANDIYNKCELIIENKIDKNNLINNAFEKVKKYDYKKLSAEYLEMYKELR